MQLELQLQELRMLEWLPLRLEAASTKLHSLLTRHLLYGVLLGFSLSVTSTSLALYFQERKRQRVQEQFEPRPIELRSDEVLDGVTGLIGGSLPRNLRTCNTVLIAITGNTPLVRINSLSNALGVEILGKAEVGVMYDTEVKVEEIDQFYSSSIQVAA